MTIELSSRKVLLVGAGGLGAPAALALCRSGVGRIDVLDDDRVERSNLQRQTFYTEADVGQRKAPTAALRLEREARTCGHRCSAVAREMRLLPATALELVRGYDLVLEGTDNFASKFLVADACALARVPVVHAGAVRWVGWALGSVPAASACLRCVFEDIPRGRQDTCAAAGVVGPVVGVVGALQASIALGLLSGRDGFAGQLWSYRGLAGALRKTAVARAEHCQLCRGEILDIELGRYVSPEHAA